MEDEYRYNTLDSGLGLRRLADYHIVHVVKATSMINFQSIIKIRKFCSEVDTQVIIACIFKF